MESFERFLAPAKLNLFLHVVGRRPDGYHLLQSVFCLIDLYDSIYIDSRSDGKIVRVKEIAGVHEADDLCVKAAWLLKTHTGSAYGASIAVEKCIPLGGGLGGGSSDAATVLIALNKLWNTKLSRKELMELGLKLGADVPFFIFGKNAWVEGIGEKISPISLSPSYYVLATPQINISTQQVFSSEELTRNTIPTTIAAFSELQIGNCVKNDTFHNDLERVVSKQYPAVENCISYLKRYGAARMSGSGATAFVKIDTLDEAIGIKANLPTEFSSIPVFSYLARGLNEHPLYNLIAEEQV